MFAVGCGVCVSCFSPVLPCRSCCWPLLERLRLGVRHNARDGLALAWAEAWAGCNSKQQKQPAAASSIRQGRTAHAPSTMALCSSFSFSSGERRSSMTFWGSACTCSREEVVTLWNEHVLRGDRSTCSRGHDYRGSGHSVERAYCEGNRCSCRVAGTVHVSSGEVCVQGGMIAPATVTPAHPHPHPRPLQRR